MNSDNLTHSAPAHEKPTAKARLLSLDAFRGLVMLLMASGGFGLAKIATSYPDSLWLQWLGTQSEHATWRGCTVWDLIQPAFMFMVGVSLPWSLSKRRMCGDSFRRLFLHAAWRSILLIALAIFLTSAWSKQTEWVFTNVLAQIGLGYIFVFLMAQASNGTVWFATAMILVLYWLAFAMFPLPSADFDWQAVGVPTNWTWMTGFESHWEKNSNFAAWFDRWFLNLFPRERAFEFSSGGYQTLNFIPSTATMSFGLLTGRSLLPPANISRAAITIALFGVAGIILGLGLDWVGLCPMVKRIWTPSFALFSSGIVAIVLSAFVLVIDLANRRRWAFVFIVAGMNPLALYCMWQLSSGFIRKQTEIHFGISFFQLLGPDLRPAMERGWVLLILWVVIAWMYQRKIFLRI
ncbi:acyltransferase family protein [Pirellulaceae bacterium SH501]